MGLLFFVIGVYDLLNGSLLLDNPRRLKVFVDMFGAKAVGMFGDILFIFLGALFLTIGMSKPYRMKKEKQ